MAKRKIIEIDREKCNGCGLCTKACAEGALVLDKEKKAVLVKEIFCDGMGACLDVCPVDALKIVDRDSAEYDAKVAYQHVLKTQGIEAAQKVHPVTKSNEFRQGEHKDSSFDIKKDNSTLGKFCNGVNAAPGAHGHGQGHFHPPQFSGCPGSMARDLKSEAPVPRNGAAATGPVPSELSQWPIQLHLISPHAPYFNGCDLLIAADCTAFTLGSFHQDLLKGKKLVIACPKLDETGGYIQKIAELLKNNTVYSLTVVIMEVPCCSGLFHMVQQAVELSGTRLPVKRIVIGLDGTIR